MPLCEWYTNRAFVEHLLAQQPEVCFSLAIRLNHLHTRQLEGGPRHRRGMSHDPGGHVPSAAKVAAD